MPRLRGVTGPVCLWLIIMCALGLLLARGQAQERDQLVDRFQSRAVNGANVVGVRVDDVFTAERRQIREMSRSDWTSADFADNADLLGFGSALLLDGEGRVVATVPADPDLLGTEVASKYPHLGDTLAGKPTVSDVVPSGSGGESDSEAVVAFALPVMTSKGISVLSASFNLADGPLAASLAHQPIAGTNSVLVDSRGELILSAGDPALAQTMLAQVRRSPDHPLVAGERVVAADPVQGTEWTYVLDVPRAALLAPAASNDLGQWALLALAAGVSLAGLLVNHRAKAERIKAQHEKHQADERLRNTVQNAPVGMTLVGLDHQFVEPNKRLCQMLGYSAQELTELTFRDVTHEDDLALDLALLAQLVAGEVESYELEKRYVHQDGSLLWGRLTVSVLRDEAGALAYFVSQIEDVTEVRKARTELQQRALYDPLTGLANRSLLMDRMKVALGDERHPVTVGVGFCDLDHFKAINDTYGHQAGDEVLKEVARRLQESVRANDTVARLGGDEFVILLHDITSPSEAAAVLDRASRSVKEPIILESGVTVHTSLSGGLAIAAAGGDPDVLLRDADAAMYVAKNGGRGHVATAPRTTNIFSATAI